MRKLLLLLTVMSCEVHVHNPSDARAVARGPGLNLSRQGINLVDFSQTLKLYAENIFVANKLGKYSTLDQFRNKARGFDALLNLGEDNQISCRSIGEFMGQETVHLSNGQHFVMDKHGNKRYITFGAYNITVKIEVEEVSTNGWGWHGRALRLVGIKGTYNKNGYTETYAYSSHSNNNQAYIYLIVVTN